MKNDKNGKKEVLMVNGIIVIDKPKGYTSHDVVAKVKRILQVHKIGHTGTLDPNATGVLPLLLDNATKVSKYLIEHDKTYEVVLQLGIRTDTLDGEGNILEQQIVDWNNYSEGEIEVVLKSFLGTRKQIPPMYSAIKVKGKKLYEYARKGQNVEIPAREITIYDMDLIKVDAIEKQITFQVACSKGTYIRSLCEEIAKQLNTIGYMRELRRTKVGNFSLENAITLEELEQQAEDSLWIKKKILTVEQVLKDYSTIQLEEKRMHHFLNGVKISVCQPDGVYHIKDKKGNYIGLGIVENKKLKRDVIL